MPASKSLPLSIHSRKYLDPLPVRTSCPLSIFPDSIELVVILSPSLKFGEPLMRPVTDPSLFFLHFERDGTPFGAFFTDFGDPEVNSLNPSESEIVPLGILSNPLATFDFAACFGCK